MYSVHCTGIVLFYWQLWRRALDEILNYQKKGKYENFRAGTEKASATSCCYVKPRLVWTRPVDLKWDVQIKSDSSSCFQLTSQLTAINGDPRNYIGITVEIAADTKLLRPTQSAYSDYIQRALCNAALLSTVQFCWRISAAVWIWDGDTGETV